MALVSFLALIGSFFFIFQNEASAETIEDISVYYTESEAEKAASQARTASDLSSFASFAAGLASVQGGAALFIAGGSINNSAEPFYTAEARNTGVEISYDYVIPSGYQPPYTTNVNYDYR